ncbi:hypothetical protein QJQ45_003180 [Haematococcus lacustris]|nr:hypothetical protein QJQ45_003180 [Haematococcus lacustris]
MAKKKRKGSDKHKKDPGKKQKASRSPQGKQRQERRDGWTTRRRQVIKVPEDAVLRGCKKTRRKLREHLRLRAEIHSQLRPAPAQPASMECDTDSDSESNCESEPEPKSDSESEPEPEPVTARQRLRLYGAQDRALEQFFNKLEEEVAEVSMERHGHAKQLVVFFGAATIGTGGGWGADAVLRACCKVVCRPRGAGQRRGRVVLVDEHRTTRVSSAVNGQQPCEEELNKLSATRPAGWKPPGAGGTAPVAPRKPPQAPRSSQAATQPAASEPGPSTPPPAKRSMRTKAEPAAEPTKGTGKGMAAKAKPAPQPGRWLDRDCNTALNMQRIGESRWRPLELCWWPEQEALPAKGKEYPGLGYKRLRDKPPKAQQQQQQPAEAHHAQSQHDKHCKQRPAAEQPPPLPNPTGKQVHPDDQQLSDKYVALFVATTGTPHAALKNKFLKKAFRALGATCPSPKRVKTLIQDVYLQTRRISVLKIWDDLVAHAQNWVSELGHPGGLDKVDASFVRGVLRIFKDRALKHCQPVMAAARLLDPINFFDMGEHAQPVPPFDSLSEQQQADLAPTVSRLAGASLGAALRELNAFENADWNPAMKRRAQSMLQMQTLQQPTQPGQPSFTPIASIEARRAFWKLQAAPQFPILAKAAQRLLSAHASTAAAERNWSVWGHTYHNALRNNLSVEVAKREVYLKANVPTTDSDDEAPAVQDTLIDIMK